MVTDYDHAKQRLQSIPELKGYVDFLLMNAAKPFDHYWMAHPSTDNADIVNYLNRVLEKNNIARRGISKFIIEISQVHDALVLGQNHIIEAFFSFAHEIIEQGGKIVIQREYINDTPDVLIEFTTLAELENWKDKLNEVQLKLGRDLIG